MRRLFSVVALFAVSQLAGSALAAAKGHYAYGFDNDHKELGWAIVSDEGSNVSSLDDGDQIKSLKQKIDGDFLYIRESGERYVIRDARFVDRARAASKPLKEAGREFGEAVGKRVSASIGDMQEGRRHARLARRQARIASRIARANERGESTEALERELEEVNRELEDSPAHSYNKVSDRDRERLRERERAASRRLHEAVERVNDEMREILHDAKAKNLAESVGRVPNRDRDEDQDRDEDRDED